MLPGHFHRNQSRAPIRGASASIFIQLAVIAFVMLGVVHICLLGSTGIAKRNSLVDVSLPSATEVTYGLNSTENAFIIIGWPKHQPSWEPMIQIGKMYGQLEDIGPYLSWIHERRCGPIRRPTIVIYADKQVPMGLIKAVRRELQLNYHLKVSYAVTPIPR